MDENKTFIKYLHELDSPISKDELAEWPDDIGLFMEGLSNPDKLEELWGQLKAKKLWDESQFRSASRPDRYLANTHPSDDSIPIKNYMGRWCNMIHRPSPNDQLPPSPTPVLDEPMPPLFSLEELEYLKKIQ